MAEDREQRYPSVQAMREALLACLSKQERRRTEARHRRLQARVQPATGAVGPASQPATPSPRPTPRRPQAQTYSKPCPTCGRLNRPVARFCRRCGYCFVPPLPPALTVVRPGGARWELPIRGASTLIGRRGGREPVDLDLGYYDPDGYISRNHARITANRRRYQIIDLDSANGTFVNGERLQPRAPRSLRDDDRIRMGKVVLRFNIR